MEEITLKNNKTDNDYIFSKFPIENLSLDIFKLGEAEFNVALVTDTPNGLKKHVIGRVQTLKNLQAKFQDYIEEYKPTHILIHHGYATPTYIQEDQLKNFGFTKCFYN